MSCLFDAIAKVLLRKAKWSKEDLPVLMPFPNVGMPDVPSLVRMASVSSFLSPPFPVHPPPSFILHLLRPHQRVRLLYDTSPRVFLIIGTPDFCC
jgi:hypothetical protein